ncbi:MAG TPA: CYTH domain-containing protein [Candidatus Aminicenantes bacterium]|nr:CYTH domain-containing protein [Candidatus Aminicenantes bacterium]HRY66084.1 CYTH domain-containing protein [Candidatus Aminicenantes bacterium]HRZ72867.1 CYTH domain-containing protein [Candidatus Aminicenantes bacterium]
MTEIEIRIRIDDPKAWRDKVLTFGTAVTRERHLETEALFDFASGELRRAGRALGLRTAGRRAWLAFKGEKRKARSFIVRGEFETQVRDPKETRRILKALGLRQTFSYSLHRTVLRRSRLTICLDETTAGSFMKLAGERHEITRFAKSLGFKRADFITASYVDLLNGRGVAAGTD